MKLIHRALFVLSASFTLALPFAGNAQQIKILFDNTKAETAGNADWQIDADLFNLSGSEANPARIPTPAQSTVTAATPETYWTGALSSWGIACAKLGYKVETLPHGGLITYGNTSNAQDLSNYTCYIVDEPNTRYTTAEITAIVSYVRNGGSLFMISDHDQSDRDNDGWDSPHIWNDLMAADPFGFMFDLVNISGTYTNAANLPADSILHGRNGSVTAIKYSNGTTMSLTGSNADVTGLLYTTAGTAGSGSNIVCLKAKVGTGKIVSIGDSSPMDDGTGDTHDQLYQGWTDLSGNHSRLLMNATIWLVSPTLTETEPAEAKPLWNLAGNQGGFLSRIANFNNNTARIEVYNTLGQQVLTTAALAAQQVALPAEGFYVVRLVSGGSIISKTVVFGR